MVYIDSTYWAKLAFENSDATGKSIVTVVTKRVSDDANGPILNDETSIWLKLIRKGDIYAMHWSKDGQHFSMARLFTLPHRKAVKVGVAAQCPAGNKATHEILYFSIEPSTVEDLRKGQ
jgi:regulation of enolase protein 1 (concanavalin A-like superfamily)